ncbi:MAG: Acg family FMN-binding oxidoreductase [Sporomusa sp.]
MMKNKRFKMIIISLLLAAVVMFVVGMAGKAVVIQKNTDLDITLSNDLKEILYYASLAPSGYNVQNWQVIVLPSQNRMRILLDKNRVLAAIDPNAREAYISIGALLENLNQSFAAFGYKTQIDINEDEASNIAATVSYKKDTSANADTSSLAVIEKRHTDKSNYQNTPIPEDKLSILLSKYHANLFYFAKGTNEYSYLSNGTIAAFQQQSDNQDKRNELATWLRFSNEETLKLKDGLPAEQLGLTGFKKAFYYLLSNRNSAKGDSFAQQGVAMATDQVKNCSGFFVITGNNNKKGLIQSGMLLQAFWLDATRNNIAIHPMSQILEEIPYVGEIAGKLNTDKPIQMILRAGVAETYGENKKIRRDLKDFVTVKN